MDSKARMVAGSHNRNEFVMIRHDGENGPNPLKTRNGQVCQICGDIVGLTETGEVFVACNECAFPVCRPCYEYERKDGNQSCTQCKTRYKRQKGSPRVPGDEEEDGVDDLDNEFNYTQRNGKTVRPWQHGQKEEVDLSLSSRHESQHRIPRLTSGQKMIIPTVFDDAVEYIRVLMGFAFLGVVIGIGTPASSLTPITPKCIAGDFEVSAMVVGFVLLFFFTFYAVGLTFYGRLHFMGDKNLNAHDIPTRHLYYVIVCVYSFIVLAYMTACITFFFMLEVRYRKFQCQPRIFQFGITSLAISIIVGCCNVIYVWQIPHQ